MSRLELLRKFLSVHKCGGCGQILSFDDFDNTFCDECYLQWSSATLRTCKECFLPARNCCCMPKTLAKSGALCLRKTVFYENENSFTPQMRLLYSIKRRKNGRYIKFLASLMYKNVTEELATLGDVSPVVTNVPRRRSSCVEYGFDQAQLIARELAKRSGFEYIQCFCQSFGAKEQKGLGKRERIENAKCSIALLRSADVRGRYVVLVDDMVTTGASMAVCTKMLMENGAKGVICASVASREEKIHIKRSLCDKKILQFGTVECIIYYV